MMTDLLARVAATCQVGGEGGFGLLVGMLLAGLAGSFVHCAPMCGPFVLGQMADRMARLPATRLCEMSRLRSAMLLPYHAGRLTSYALLGGLGAGVGAGLGRGGAALLSLAAVLFALHGLHLLAPATIPHPGRRAPRWWGVLIGHWARRIDATHWSGGMLLGGALGFLPCGMLYAALAAAAGAASGVGGALCMLAFGLGTLPALVLIALAGQAVGRRLQRAVASLTPVVLIANAGVLAVMAWNRAVGPF